MAKASQSVGDLLIDLRLNQSQLQADLEAVKGQIAKSSREMSSDMKSDMQETRQTLALMRDDFGVGIPREMRKAIASVEILRDAILGLQGVFFGLAFLNIGEEFAKKFGLFADDTDAIKKKLDDATAAENAFFAAVSQGNAAHEERLRLIGLIGKSQDDIFKSNFQHNQDLINQQKQIVQGMVAQINAKAALLALDIEGIRNAGPGSEAAQSNPLDDINKLNADFQTFVKTLQKPLIDAQNQLQALEDNGLALTKQHEEEKRQEYKKTADDQQKSMEAALAKLKEFQAKEVETLDPLVRVRIEWDNIRQVQAAILEQHPELQMYAVATISAEVAATHKILLELDRQIVGQLHTANAELETMQKSQGMNPLSGIIGSMQGGLPQLQPDMIGAAVQRFAGSFKDAAAQGKLLEKAMDDLLTPMDKFRIEQQEVDLLKDKFKDYPDVVKALNNELLKANPDFQKLVDASKEFGQDLSTELDNLVLKSESFHDFLVNIAKDIEEIALKALLLKPLQDFFSGGSSGSGGFLSIFTGLFGARAGGGPVDGGSPYLVGEKGPELFMPSSSGTIVPNGAFGGGGGTVFNIDARGAAPGSEVAIIRGVQKAMRQNVKKSVAAGVDYQRRH